jgi:hypothetical protein
MQKRHGNASGHHGYESEDREPSDIHEQIGVLRRGVVKAIKGVREVLERLRRHEEQGDQHFGDIHRHLNRSSSWQERHRRGQGGRP